MQTEVILRFVAVLNLLKRVYLWSVVVHSVQNGSVCIHHYVWLPCKGRSDPLIMFFHVVVLTPM